ncbi:hypothetical protein OHS33_21095 [Streptomyces sp. NBC_00536]|uniref:hypothetical protein n=1 Tax=Streptomyces sp. NBC_00536 TaxID=2975769 RepID=UPI002E817215|nr:hypothetical protein [Streptomyces sp. NBC_00536]WUC80597.1 hypothetical protein OHS33_21095 [Streptomyces sp. NBC_00536]
MAPRTGRTLPLTALALAAATALTLSPTTATATTATTPTADLARASLASRRYLREQEALTAGYPSDTYCIANKAGPGALGYPHFNHANDGSLDPERPAALFYEDDGHGGRRLVALEWMVKDRDGKMETDDDRPSMFGQPFEGPLPSRFPGQGVHYSLHLWLWKANPDGRFATHNPRVRCLPGTTRPPKTP